jgi:hypothetical protein
VQVNNLTTLYNYYKTAYAAVRAYSPDCFITIATRTWEQDSVPKASATPASWQTFMTAPTYTNVLLDLHKCALTQQTVIQNDSDIVRLQRPYSSCGQCAS